MKCAINIGYVSHTRKCFLHMKYRMSFKYIYIYIYIYIGYHSDSFKCYYIYFFLWHTGLRTLGMVGVGEGRHTFIGFAQE